MKKLSILALFIGLLFLVVAAIPQDKKIDHKKHMQMMEMMKDSQMMEMMIEHIVKDEQLRMKMMSKMMDHCKSDTSMSNSMCKMMKKDDAPKSKTSNIKGIPRELKKEKKDEHENHHPPKK